MNNYDIQRITGDNRRPGMPADHHWLVRYDRHPAYGWLCCKTFVAETEAREFAKARKALEVIA